MSQQTMYLDQRHCLRDGIVGLSISWCRLKYLKYYWMDCYEMLCRHSRPPEDESYYHFGDPHFSSNATVMLPFAVFVLTAMRLFKH